MKLTEWFLNFDFQGRARRSHHWANVGCWLGVFIVLMLITGALGDTAASAVPGVLLLVAVIASFVDNLAMTFRRAHDTGKSGWIWLLLLIPFVNLLPMYWLLIEDSQQGPNKYGPPVKQFYTPDAQAA